MECFLDDEDEDRRPNSVISLSRSISGTFQAIPAKILEEEHLGGPMEENKNIQTAPEVVPQVFAKERQEFCKSMLATHNDNKG